MDYIVVEARYVRDYVIWFRFRDGLSGEVDLKDILWGGVFEPLRNIEYFRQFRLNAESDTIEWPNGADIAPDSLHMYVRGDIEARSYDAAGHRAR
jgi:hypothetical protein